MSFLDESIKIADDFVKTVCFIDDEPFFRNSEDPKHGDVDHRLNANSITKAFASKGKTCSFFLFEKEKEQDMIIRLSSNNDVNIIDWKINLIEEQPLKPEDAEKDIPYEEGRGKHALKLIEGILNSSNNCPKLIVILTAEVDGASIHLSVKKLLESLEFKFDSKEEDFSFQSDNFRISIYFKESLRNMRASEDVKKKIIKNDDLPDLISHEFATLTSGLVSNALIKSVSIIRNNVGTLLKLFNKEIDSAYLGHRILLPNQEDSESLLIDLITDSIGDLLHYHNAKDTVSKAQIERWIDEKIDEKEFEFIGIDHEKKEVKLEGKYSRNKDLLKRLLNEGFKSAFNLIAEYNKLGPDKALFKKYFELSSTSLFIVGNIDYKIVDKHYAKLTHHKSLFKANHIIPRLDLGSVVKGDKTGYYVCIQQRCDSVRLGQEERRFLFLPLKELKAEASQKFHFLTSEGARLQLQKKSFNLRTIKFVESGGEGVVRAVNRDGKMFFDSIYRKGHQNYSPEADESYEWILDLKNMHAQRIVQEFASEISRVGLDESEWLRRSATK